MDDYAVCFLEDNVAVNRFLYGVACCVSELYVAVKHFSACLVAVVDAEEVVSPFLFGCCEPV